MKKMYHPDVEAELLDSIRFYEEKVSGLGERFLNAFEAAMTQIQEGPERWQRVDGEFRHYIMPDFPFGIYDRVAGGELRVLAIKHHSRHPDYWFYCLNESQ